ncbi:hypothetical protein tpqmel_0989 [Candidatus Gastranaerophilus sp. (ex Termes propinquus)]|nr:hypothetical protein tpqmel_0989 [Candidatus Gastranaerophilus sp. (ex Termes propinquus)]
MPLRKIFKMSHETQTKIYSKLIVLYFNFKKYFFYSRSTNIPQKQHILAMWHAHQCGIYGIEGKKNMNVMISRSKDGDIIASAAKSLGINTVRGSQSRGGAVAALEMIEALKAGQNGAITIDGPRGPKRIVKKGIVEIAKISGVPIVPMTWYSPSWGFFKLKTWDEFRFPLNCIKMVILYGEPIYVKPDATEDEIEVHRKAIEDELNALYSRVKKDFKHLWKTGQKLKDRT